MQCPPEKARYVGTWPKNVYENGGYSDRQETDKKSGKPIWTVDLDCEDGNGRSDRVRVCVVSEKEPCAGIARGAEVALVSPRVEWWNFKDGRTVVKLSADDVVEA